MGEGQRPAGAGKGGEMAKYTIDHACGHSREVQLYGPGKERTRKLEWMAGQDCPQCWGAKQREIEAAKPITMTIRCNGLDEDEHGNILAEVVLTGGTQPRKEEIRDLGYRWGEVRGGVMDMISINRAPLAWIKRVPIIELAKGHATAIRLQADAKALGATITAQLNPLDIEMARRRVADKCEQDARIAAIPKPIRPPCHPLEAHPEGTWNKKYYGIGKSGCRYYVSGIEYVLSAEEYHQCAAYRKAMEDYRAKVELAKAGKEVQ